MSELIIEQIGSRSSKWGECPIFWQDHLYYVDIEGHALIRLNPQNGEEKIWDMGERIGAVVPCQSGDLLLSLIHI